MSDGVAIDQLDAMTGDRTVSGAVALEAGVDMGLWDTGFARLEEAVEQGSGVYSPSGGSGTPDSGDEVPPGAL